ncbi:HTH-type transcriptional regulator LeuO [Roseisalinus antarcticus]|uniref:HTH-type transcriptional regulator LeuO n=2 Tax=Roseisalinus antarcticus TaxID=254357 RepID=A0A1Y5RHW4_9RHOB|nr:HTH-type transcriptional regulator LeuO [Roseisalinus antarcticus]
MNQIQLHRLDLNLLVTFEALMDERSVVRAADRLGKTPSAVSHALGRLRDQLGDPLLVKVGGKMQPSPFALQLIEDVRPILRRIERVVQPAATFEPETSHRVFRIAIPSSIAVVSEILARVNAAAPNVGVDWIPASPKLYGQVIDEQVDMALLGADVARPDGVAEQLLPPMRRYVFARRGHPALADWGADAWRFWPHVMVGMSQAARQTVEERASVLGIERRVGARIPDFAGVAPLLARTNMIANQLPVFMAGDIERFDLAVLQPPVALPDLTMRFFWSARLSADSANRWIRGIVINAFREVATQAEGAVAERLHGVGPEG